MPPSTVQDAPFPRDPASLAAQTAFLGRLARGLVGAGEVDDLVQDAWLRALERPPREAGRAWLATVARRLAANLHRSRGRRGTREERAARPEPVEPAERALEQLELGRRLFERVAELDEPYRTVVFLRYWEELSPAEIAARLGAPVKTVKSRLTRSLELLRARLDADGGGRERWLAALAPLALGREALPPVALGSGATLGGIVAVKKLVLAAAVVVLVLVGWRVLSAPGGADPLAAAPARLEEGGSVLDARGESATLMVGAKAAVAAREAARASAPARATGEQPAGTGALRVRLTWAESGAPAVGVAVDALCAADPAPREERLSATSDAHGEAFFPALFAGDVRLWLDRGTRHEAKVRTGVEQELSIALPRGIEVRGRVLDAAGAPVAEADLWLEQPYSPAWGHRLARTAPDGSFALRVLDPRLLLSARHRDHAPSLAFSVDELPATPDGWRELELRLGEPGSRVAGRVLDPDGAPVAGAVVKVGRTGGWVVDLRDGRRAARARMMPVTTDAVGRFESPGALEPGSAALWVMARGWPAVERPIEVAAAGTTRVEVVLEPPVTVRGRVVDEAGGPVAGALVGAYRDPGGFGLPSGELPASRTTADAQGLFELRWVRPGEVALHAQIEDRPELGRAEATLSCAPGLTEGVELVLRLGPAIEGRVVDGAGFPLAGWRVHASSGSAIVLESGEMLQVFPRWTTTDVEGRFRLGNLERTALYELSVSGPGDSMVVPRASLDGVAPGTRELEIVVADAGLVEGRIVGRVGLVDGALPTHLSLLCRRKGESSASYVEFDPESGAFAHDTLPGAYTVQLMRGGQNVATSPELLVEPGATVDAGVIELVPGGRVALTLEGLPESFREHAMLWLQREDHASERLELEDGLWRSREVEAGAWTLQSMNAGFLPDLELEVRPGETTRVELASEPAVEVRVRLTAPSLDGRFPGDLRFEIRTAGGALVRRRDVYPPLQPRPGPIAIPFLVLPSGDFELDVHAEGGLSARTSIHVPSPLAPIPPVDLELR